MECVRLRIKDVEFSYSKIVVRDGKGVELLKSDFLKNDFISITLNTSGVFSLGTFFIHPATAGCYSLSIPFPSGSLRDGIV